MTADEGTLVDGLAARAPKADFLSPGVTHTPSWDELCSYWKGQSASLPPDTPGAHRYVEVKTDAVCKEATKQAENVDRAEITVERKDGKPKTVVVRFFKGKQPLAKALFSISIGATTVKGRTEADGSVRADATALRAQVYVTGSQVPPRIGLSAGEGSDIMNPKELVALYQSWIDDEKAGAVEAREKADAEVTSGKCAPEREARLVNMREKLVAVFNAPGTLTIEQPTVREAKILVATESGASATMSVGAGKDAHVLAIALAPVKLEARNQKGVAATEMTEYEALAQQVAGPNTASRRMAATPGDDLTMTVRGHGCALVLLLRKF